MFCRIRAKTRESSRKRSIKTAIFLEISGILRIGIDKLEFGEEDHIWKLLEDSKTCSGASRISTLRIENLLSELLQKESEISAPAKALLEKIDPAGIESWTPNSFSHQIRKSVDTLRQTGIFVSFRKSNGERLICLKRAVGAALPTTEKIVPIDPVGGQTACTAP